MIGRNDCFCTQLSRDAGEHLFGTASRVDVWLLFEYAGPWKEEAFRDSEMPDSIKVRLYEWLNIIPRSRLLLIRQHERRTTDLRFYVAFSRERQSVLYEFRLDTCEALLDLDVPAVLRESPEYSAHISERLVFLVCTNGLHDKCCAKLGRPVYGTLAEREDVVAWQSTHLGGDRFAANVVCLPHGIYYGRVGAGQDVDPIVEATKRGEIYLPNYRGRSCYNFVVQAAEYFIRERTGNMRIDGLEFVDIRQPRQGHWTTTFMSTDDGSKHSVQVSQERMGVRNYLVCKAQEQSDLLRYRLDGYEVTSDE